MRSGDIGAEAHVVFHVAARQFDFGTAFKFSKQISRFFAQDVNQNIQTATVCHTDDDFFHAVFTGVLNQIVQTGNGTFTTFDTETFLTDIFGMQITFQSFGGSHFFQDTAFLIGIVMRCGQYAFKIIAHPTTLFSIGNIDIFQCNVAAVGLFQIADDLGKGQFALTGKVALAHIELKRHVGIRQTMEFRVECFDVLRGNTFERIKLGRTHALNTIGRNQSQNADLLFHHCLIHTTCNSRCNFLFSQSGK